MVLMEKIMEEPMWLQAWVFWMMIVNTASILFVKHMAARVTLGCWLGNIVFMSILLEYTGYTRLLGLSHVVFWTPLIAYLIWTWANIKDNGLYTRWVQVLIATNTISLVIDYIDVIRWAIGDGALE